MVQEEDALAVVQVDEMHFRKVLLNFILVEIYTWRKKTSPRLSTRTERGYQQAFKDSFFFFPE